MPGIGKTTDLARAVAAVGALARHVNLGAVQPKLAGVAAQR
jgi:hypothetical protein